MSNNRSKEKIKKSLNGIFYPFIVIIILLACIPVNAEIKDPQDPEWKLYPYQPEGTDIVFPNDEGAHSTVDYPIEWWCANFHLTGQTTGNEYGSFVAFYHIQSVIFENEEMRLFTISDTATEETYTNAEIGTLTASNDHLDLGFEYLNNANQDSNHDNQQENLQTEYTEMYTEATYQSTTIDTTQLDTTQSTPLILGDGEKDSANSPIQYDCWYTKTNDNILLPFQYAMVVGGDSREDNQPMGLSVDMDCLKAPLIVSGDGYEVLGDDGKFSYYYSLTRVTVTGSITVHGITEQVTGYAWVDHQWGDMINHDLTPLGLAVTCERFSIKLDDNREIMACDTWDAETGLKDDPSVIGGINLLNQDNTLDLLSDYTITPQGFWIDPISHRRFACQWHITESSKPIDLIVTPDYLDQMMRANENFPLIQQFLAQIIPESCFWEGSGIVTGTIAGIPVTGKTFIELTRSPPLEGGDFILPPLGGGLVHCTPDMTDNIKLPIPTSNVGIKWHQHSLGGELFGTWGNGIAGNGNIAACTFTNYFGVDNLIIYDYDGNHLWSSGGPLKPWGLNFLATASTPMVDMNGRVVACDNRKIILVNASDHDNVYVEWISEIPHEKQTLKDLLLPIPFSPNIVENRTIILPTQGGPLLAYDVRTGEKIAEKWLGRNESTFSYLALPDMPLLDFLAIIATPNISPYHYDSVNNVIEWVSSVDYGIMPFAPVFYEGNVMFKTNADGLVSAIDMVNNSYLVSNYVQIGENVSGEGYYSTINSACVKGNRIYLATEATITGDHSINNCSGRLYAVDLNPDAVEDERLAVAWYYDYFGKSQATPTLIGDTLYFDGYNGSILFDPGTNEQHSIERDVHIYAVYTNGTEKWKRAYPNVTEFSFSRDPRGGFWYEDCEQTTFDNQTGGNKLVHFSEENGNIIEELDMKTLLNDTGENKDEPVLPSSDMTICGNSTRPIMLISANHQWNIPGKWVLAIDLADNNNVLWKVPINSTFDFNYANGQYTILMKDNEPRILFGTWLAGVMAIGSDGGDGDDEMTGNQYNIQSWINNKESTIGSSPMTEGQQFLQI